MVVLRRAQDERSWAPACPCLALSGLVVMRQHTETAARRPGVGQQGSVALSFCLVMKPVL